MFHYNRFKCLPNIVKILKINFGKNHCLRFQKKKKFKKCRVILFIILSAYLIRFPINFFFFFFLRASKHEELLNTLSRSVQTCSNEMIDRFFQFKNNTLSRAEICETRWISVFHVRSYLRYYFQSRDFMASKSVEKLY